MPGLLPEARLHGVLEHAAPASAGLLAPNRPGPREDEEGEVSEAINNNEALAAWLKVHRACDAQVSALTTRLADAVAAETRLAEVERERDDALAEGHLDQITIDHLEREIAVEREVTHFTAWKSAEQLLSEMAEGVRALDLWAREGSPLTLIQRLDPIILQVRAILAKYDARAAEAR